MIEYNLAGSGLCLSLRGRLLPNVDLNLDALEHGPIECCHCLLHILRRLVGGSGDPVLVDFGKHALQAGLGHVLLKLLVGLHVCWASREPSNPHLFLVGKAAESFAFALAVHHHGEAPAAIAALAIATPTHGEKGYGASVLYELKLLGAEMAAAETRKNRWTRPFNSQSIRFFGVETMTSIMTEQGVEQTAGLQHVRLGNTELSQHVARHALRTAA